MGQELCVGLHWCKADIEQQLGLDQIWAVVDYVEESMYA